MIDRCRATQIKITTTKTQSTKMKENYLPKKKKSCILLIVNKENTQNKNVI